MADLGATVSVGGDPAAGGGSLPVDNRGETFHAPSPTVSVGGGFVAVPHDNRRESVVAAGSVIVPDTTPPAVTLVSPTGGEIARTGELVLRVTDTGGLQRAAVFHTPQGGRTEMVYEGVGLGLRSGYSGSRVDVAGGFELTVRRVGGWFPPLVFEVLAYDDSGNTTPA